MKDHQLGYTLPLQPLGAKIERHQATPEDRRAIELCKFEQKRHEVEPAPLRANMTWFVGNWTIESYVDHVSITYVVLS